MKYIDIHSHLNLSEFEADLEDTIVRLQSTDTGTIVVGTDFETSKKAVEIAEDHADIFACIGVHPVDDKEKIFDKEKFAELVTSKKVVAIGECGLDYFHADKNDAEERLRQQKLFLDQIEFAVEYNLPIMIHSRDAYIELLDMLEPLVLKYKGALRGNVHFFAGDLTVAKRFIQLGFTLSFTGVITFARSYDEVIKNIPLISIMSETDSPFVSPVPYRGKRNEPSYVQQVVKKIAELRGEELEIVQKAMLENASRLFKINLAQIG
ncbi:TatD family hydrolase [soil metagenome]